MPPGVDGGGQFGVGVGVRGGAQVGGLPGEDERDAETRGDGDLGDRGAVGAVGVHPGRDAQPGGVGAGDGDPVVPGAAHPRVDPPVVEPQPQFAADRDGALQPLDDPDQPGRAPSVRAALRHEVGDPDPALGGVPLGVEDEAVRPVAAGGALAGAGGG